MQMLSITSKVSTFDDLTEKVLEQQIGVMKRQLNIKGMDKLLDIAQKTLFTKRLTGEYEKALDV